MRRARAAVARAGGRRELWRTAVLAVLLLVAFVVLVGLNLALRSGLWGDLVFAVLVTTGALIVTARVATPLIARAGLPQPHPLRALLAAVFLLVGFPLAITRLPLGFALLLLGFAVWGLVALALRLAGSERSMPPLWTAGVAGLALLFLVVALTPTVAPADRVPRAVPAASLEERDAVVARLVRPRLFLDRGEVRYPLDIEDAIAGGRVSQCREGVTGGGCDPVERAQEIDTSYDYLRFAEGLAPPVGGGDTSAYYYRVVRPEGDARVFVDFWWFYARNPSPVAASVFCAPGLRMPPLTCQEHESDWEGLTVVLRPCAPEQAGCVNAAGERLAPTSVRYAQHEHVAAYAWRPTLVTLWERLGLPRTGSLGARPLAFVARNSHASYPFPCRRRCQQQTRDLPESSFDGSIPWSHNESCDGCLKPLPETPEGDPALWNAFPGPWGTQNCILAGAYCDLSRAPEAPARQGRYRDPAREGPWLCLRDATARVPVLERCPEPA